MSRVRTGFHGCDHLPQHDASFSGARAQRQHQEVARHRDGYAAFFQREVNESGQNPVLEQETCRPPRDEVPPVHVRPIRLCCRPRIERCGGGYALEAPAA